jgi:methyl-accepting chemotaxis protein
VGGVHAVVNALIGDLVHPITETARVIGAVAKGDLSQNMALESDGRPLKGQFLSTARTVNTMVDQLSSFARKSRAWRARSARKASSAARPRVEGGSGTWKDLTDNVNLMASNLTARCATSRP